MSITHVTASTFQQEVLNSEKTVLLDFWATWCGPCRMIAPILEEIAAERDDVKVCKVDVDEEQQLAMQYGISSIPTLLVIRHGSVVRSNVGAIPKSAILEMLK